MNRDLKSFYNHTEILIPGGAGFIGSSLAKKLISYGANVTVVDPLNPLCGANLFNIKEIRKDIVFKKEKIEDFIPKNGLQSYGIVFNCVGLSNHHIGYRDVGLDYDINCLSGVALLEKAALAKAKCRIISIGSRSQYGKPDSVLIDEAYPMRPLDVQAIHKVTLEHYHAAFSSYYGLDLLYVRLTNVYGPGQRMRGDGIGFMGEIIRSAVLGKEVIIYGNVGRVKDILFVDDAVNALLLLGVAKSPAHRVFNIGGQRCVLGELVEALKSKAVVKIKVVPFSDNIKKMDTGGVVLKTDRLTRQTGWVPRTDITKGVSETVDFYKRYAKYFIN